MLFQVAKPRFNRGHFLRSFAAWAGLTSSILPGAQIAEAQTSSVRSTIQVFRVDVQNGREVLVESRSAEPGDFIVYRVRYQNMGRDTVRNFSPSLSIPNPMMYVANSASPSKIMASVDARIYAPVPLFRTNSQSGKARKQVRIAPSEYKSLRWNLGALKPGQSVVVSARVQMPIPRRAMRAELIA